MTSTTSTCAIPSASVERCRRRRLTSSLAVVGSIMLGIGGTELAAAGDDESRSAPAAGTIDVKDHPGYGGAVVWRGDVKDHPGYGGAVVWRGDVKDRPGTVGRSCGGVT